jgi:fibronectin type 3 domain-containing protein
VTVSGLSPTNLKSVYGFSTATAAGSGKTIAIVDAYNDPTAATDLSTFSSQWGLPACTTTNGCFAQVNQTGGTTLPATDTGWALEISLDVQWAHAVAPGAKILLVEATNNSMSNLMAAEQYAGNHANYVSNSWGGSEFSGETSEDALFPGSASYFAATGDTGGAVDYPATSPKVIAVGGTSLKFNTNGSLASETAWSSGGGGCSAYEPAPAAQSGFAQFAQAGCTGRAVPDVALDADPSSGVAVFDSTSYEGSSGWWTVGGTSVATPIWAAASAAAGVSPTLQSVYGSSSPPSFRDITGGSNGHPTLVGYDLATGRGSWANGVSGAPGTLSATGSNAQVSLSWTAASGATSYDVYRGTTAKGLSTTPIATNVTGVTYNNTTVTNGTAYYYEVEGVNSVGVGVPSNEATATPSASGSSGSGSGGSGGGSGGASGGTNPPPVTAPPAPTGLTAAVGSSSVTLHWNAATGATTYTVLRSTSSGAETTYVTSVTPTTYVDTGVTPGTTYYYKVEGVNTAGPGSPSSEASAVIPSHIVAGIAKNCSSASCQFSSTSTDQGGTITTYSWSTSGGTGSGATFSHNFTTAGTYTVYLSVSDNKGSSGSTSVNVTCTQSRSIFRFSSSLTCS